MTPKSLLRNKLAISKLADFAPGTHFLRVIPDTEKSDAKKIKRVVFTSGKVYYDLYEEREKRGLTDTALVRIEQYYPFPAKEIAAEIARYKDAEIVWAQEEPENMGAWRFLAPRIGALLEQTDRKDKRIRYAGRAEAASPAAGYLKIHQREQQQVLDDTFGGAEGKAALKKAAG
jgi:2-oxoglutarate dehydrogenase E1 component